MIDVGGTTLSAEDREVLRHPLVAGVILFARNVEDPKQVSELTSAIRQVNPGLLVAVDQEGGRVRRLRKGYAQIPAMGRLSPLAEAWNTTPESIAESFGWIIAAEIQASGIDFTFAPVLDIDHGVSSVIGDRSFGATADTVTRHAAAFVKGMHGAGAAAVGKHFPGHGAVAPDSHETVPVDSRDLMYWETEWQPFARLKDVLQGVMPAHIVIETVDALPVSLSRDWLENILRQRLGFAGAVISDDLSMAGAASFGSPEERAQLAWEAGSDLLLVCNDRNAVWRILERATYAPGPESLRRLRGLRARGQWDWASLAVDPRYARWCEQLQQCDGDSASES
jgi:beta-N-acetylhexosaminidase